MHILFISLFLSGFVSIAGLVSCSPEKRTPDVYRVPPPLIVSENGQEDLKMWDTRPLKTLDLQDVLDVSAGRPSRVNITSECRVDDRHFRSDLQASSRADFPFWALVPRELLTRKEMKDIDCSFVVRLYNAESSSHVFHISQVKVVEKRAPTVQIERDGRAVHSSEHFKVNAPERMILRFQNKTAAKIHLVCPDISPRPLPFDSVRDLGDFNFSAAQRTLVIQTCRAIVFESGRPVAISSPFKIEVMDSAALTIETGFSIKTGALTEEETSHVLEYLRRREPLGLGRVKITNTDREAKTFALSQPRQPVEIKMAVAHETLGPGYFEWQVRKNAYKIVAQNGRDLPALTTLEPGKSLELKLIFYSGPLHCTPLLEALSIQQLKPFSLDIVNETGKAIASKQFSFQNLQWETVITKSRRLGEQAACPWPDLN